MCVHGRIATSFDREQYPVYLKHHKLLTGLITQSFFNNLVQVEAVLMLHSHNPFRVK